MTAFTRWSDLLLEASRRDFTTGFVNGQHAGPTRTSRAMAIAHVAMRDAARAGTPADTWIVRKGLMPPPPPAGYDAAAGLDGAAFRALSTLYPASLGLFEPAAAGAADRTSFAYGEAVAQTVLDARAQDGASAEPPYAYAPGYGRHAPDPFSPAQRPLTPHWGEVAHFVGPRAPLDAFPGAGLPNFLADPHYLEDFEEVRDLGSRTRGARTPAQEATGVFWGYDGADGIGVPPRLYNQIARLVAAARGLTEARTLDLMTVVNVAMADAGIDAWHWKYAYDLWRPAVGLRVESADLGGDPFWAAFGVPRSVVAGVPAEAPPPATPGFPAYPSGHATFGAAMFQALRLDLGAPAMTTADVLAAGQTPTLIPGEAFTFVSDELDGMTRDAGGAVRARVERVYPSYARAVFDNALSRVFLGVHWRFDGLPRDAGDLIGGVPLGLAIGARAHAFFAPAPAPVCTAAPVV